MNNTPPSLPSTAVPSSLPAAWDDRLSNDVAELDWKISILQPALELPKNSHARGLMLAGIAGKPYHRPDGKVVTPKERTLREWLRKIEAKPQAGGLPLKRRRIDRGQRRVLISQAWDAACPLPDTEKRRIAAEIDVYMRSLWASGMPGADTVAEYAGSKLIEICHVAGWNGANLDNCAITRHAAYRHADARLVAIKERDAKRFADIFMPRIVRSRAGLLPLAIVVGDVHPIDIIVRREDGTEATPRLIGWLDMATNSLQYSLALCDAGRSIRQVDIVSSFVGMCAAWGLPEKQYLDNGTEYKWEEMVVGFDALTGLNQAFKAFLGRADELADLAEENAAGASGEKSIEGDYIPAGAADPQMRSTVRAKPYNAAAKPIEGIFRVLTRYYSMIPGYIGGNRMAKRTHAVGEAPKPYPGTWEQFRADFKVIIDRYHNTPQRGTLQGLSPNQAMQKHIDAGWKSTPVQREVFILAFAETITRKVFATGVEIDGAWYEADALIPYRGEKVSIRYAKWEPSRVLLIHPDGRYSAIPRAIAYAPLDRAGAIESGRRIGAMNAHFKALKAGTHPIDRIAETRRHAQHFAGQPDIPQGAEIILSDAQRDAVAALQTTPEPKTELRALPGELRNAKTGEVRRMAAPVMPMPTPLLPVMPQICAPPQKQSGTAASVPDLLKQFLDNQPLRKASK